MIPSWLVIGLVTFLVAIIVNRLSPDEIRWFFRLRRPKWLTFEKAIPFIWTFIFICGAWSAYIVWEATAGQPRAWWLMSLYLLLEVATLAYTKVMCKVRSLKVGTAIGAIGFIIGIIVTIIVSSISQWAVILLLPYILWSPIGTYVTWAMIKLNPDDARG